jgi:hypothetical protein
MQDDEETDTSFHNISNCLQETQSEVSLDPFKQPAARGAVKFLWGLPKVAGLILISEGHVKLQTYNFTEKMHHRYH